MHPKIILLITYNVLLEVSKLTKQFISFIGYYDIKLS